jgi:D-glycerate 3-kinase
MDPWPAEVLAWIRSLDRPAGRPLVVGVNGPQGCGKTTLCSRLVAWAAPERWFSVSIDDLYLTREEQARLAAANPAEPLLQVRGAPGTHDIPLGVHTLDALAGRSGALRVPTYDKAAFDGLGDRSPPETWRVAPLPLDVVLVEGWMLGFPALGRAGVGPVDSALPTYGPWLERMHAMVQLRAADSAAIVGWRVEAERRMRAEGRGGMSDEAALAYIQRFMPFYERYPEALARSPPCRSHRVWWIGADRAPVRSSGGDTR